MASSLLTSGVVVASRLTTDDDDLVGFIVDNEIDDIERLVEIDVVIVEKTQYLCQSQSNMTLVLVLMQSIASSDEHCKLS